MASIWASLGDQITQRRADKTGQAIDNGQRIFYPRAVQQQLTFQDLLESRPKTPEQSQSLQDQIIKDFGGQFGNEDAISAQLSNANATPSFRPDGSGFNTAPLQPDPAQRRTNALFRQETAERAARGQESTGGPEDQARSAELISRGLGLGPADQTSFPGVQTRLGETLDQTPQGQRALEDRGQIRAGRELSQDVDRARLTAGGGPSKETIAAVNDYANQFDFLSPLADTIDMTRGEALSIAEDAWAEAGPSILETTGVSSTPENLDLWGQSFIAQALGGKSFIPDIQQQAVEGSAGQVNVTSAESDDIINRAENRPSDASASGFVDQTQEALLGAPTFSEFFQNVGTGGLQNSNAQFGSQGQNPVLGAIPERVNSVIQQLIQALSQQPATGAPRRPLGGSDKVAPGGLSGLITGGQ